MSSMVYWRSGNAVRILAMLAIRPSLPSGCPGDGSSATWSSATRASATAVLPLLRNSSTRRRISALFSSVDIEPLPFDVLLSFSDVVGLHETRKTIEPNHVWDDNSFNFQK